MLTLYDFGNSVCCQKVRIVLTAKGLAWEAIPVDLFKSEQYDPAYLRLNPKGVVPTLMHDGKPVIESTLICEYIDETFRDPPLIPADPWSRTRMRQWSKMVDEGLHEGVTEISFSAMFRERMRSMPEHLREARFKNVGDPRRRDRFKSTYEFGLLGVWIDDRPRIKDWWARASDWPAFKAGLRDRVTPSEFDEMRLHGPKIRGELAAHRAGLSL